jgi:hypothetical protein
MAARHSEKIDMRNGPPPQGPLRASISVTSLPFRFFELFTFAIMKCYDGRLDLARNYVPEYTVGPDVCTDSVASIPVQDIDLGCILTSLRYLAQMWSDPRRSFSSTITRPV